MNMVLQSYPAVNNLKPLFQADLDKQVSQSVSYRGREDFLSVLHAPDDVVVDVVDARSGVNIFTHTDIIVCKCPEVNYHHYFILYIYFQIYIAGAFISDTSNRDFPRPFIKLNAESAKRHQGSRRTPGVALSDFPILLDLLHCGFFRQLEAFH